MLKLVYGCLAFSLIACVFLFVSAGRSRDDFHGMTKSMGDAIANGATVLAADSGGAITQTGNGTVTGYTRGGVKAWSFKNDRFKSSPTNPFGAGADDASAWCDHVCPSAQVEFRGHFSAFGGANASLADGLSALHTKPEDVLAFANQNTAFVRGLDRTTGNLRLYALAAGKTATAIGNLNPSEIQPTLPNAHAVAGSARGKFGILNVLSASHGTWRIGGGSISEAGLKNVCVNIEETWVGAVSTRFHRFALGGKPGRAAGPPVAGGKCTVDIDGLTAVYNPVSNPTSVVAARYSPSGRTLWMHSFGPQHLLSPAGSRYVVVQDQSGTVTAIDATTGKTVLKTLVDGIPFVGVDGSTVIASREGEPRWLLGGFEVVRVR